MRLKTGRFYIGGIHKSSSREALQKYLKKKDVHVTFIRYFNNNDRRTASVQINVLLEDKGRVENSTFSLPTLF